MFKQKLDFRENQQAILKLATIQTSTKVAQVETVKKEEIKVTQPECSYISLNNTQSQEILKELEQIKQQNKEMQSQISQLTNQLKEANVTASCNSRTSNYNRVSIPPYSNVARSNHQRICMVK